MDNFRIDVLAEGRMMLEKAISFAFMGSRSLKGAIGYRIDPDKGLIFLWAEPNPKRDGYVPFPFKMDGVGAADFAARWLEQTPYPREPDHDGDNHKGFRVYNEAWGHVGTEAYAICAVLPAWAMYGK